MRVEKEEEVEEEDEEEEYEEEDFDDLKFIAKQPPTEVKSSMWSALVQTGLIGEGGLPTKH